MYGQQKNLIFVKQYLLVKSEYLWKVTGESSFPENFLWFPECNFLQHLQMISLRPRVISNFKH